MHAFTVRLEDDIAAWIREQPGSNAQVLRDAIYDHRERSATDRSESVDKRLAELEERVSDLEDRIDANRSVRSGSDHNDSRDREWRDANRSETDRRERVRTIVEREPGTIQPADYDWVIEDVLAVLDVLLRGETSPGDVKAVYSEDRPVAQSTWYKDRIKPVLRELDGVVVPSSGQRTYQIKSGNSRFPSKFDDGKYEE